MSGGRALRRAVCALAAAAPLAAECHDGTAPALRSTYVLRSVGDSVVPYTLYAYAAVRVVRLADTLAFREDGTLLLTSVVREDSAGGPSRVDATRATQHWRLHGDTVDVTFTCPPGADCIGPPLLMLRPDGWLVSSYPAVPALPASRYQPLGAPLDRIIEEQRAH